MKNLYLLALAAISAMSLSGQTFIGNSSNPYATANHNQRKIVRDSFDNIYVVFIDEFGQNQVIKGVVYNSSGGAWSYPVVIASGTNPTLAIEPDNQIHLIYQTNNMISAIKHSSSPDFMVWSEPETISDSSNKSFIPVADFDAENLHIFWVQENSDLTQSVVYGRIEADTLAEQKVITTKNQINDVAMACHLMYHGHNVLFAIQFDEDSLQFFMSENYLQTMDTLYQAIGSQPCITYNSAYTSGAKFFDAIRFIYINSYFDLIEVEVEFYFDNVVSRTIQHNVNFVSIDNIMPMIGYSYLFMDDEYLYHAFSYGSDAYLFGDHIMEAIWGLSFIENPSIAYKHFNPLFVDFIWMSGDNILHMQDEKHEWIPTVEETDGGESFTVAGYPNPFSDVIHFKVTSAEKIETPTLQIFDTKAKLVIERSVDSYSGNEYFFQWNGIDETGVQVNKGVYIVLFKAGTYKRAWKVMFKP